MFAKNTEQPIRMKVKRLVTRCSTTPRNLYQQKFILKRFNRWLRFYSYFGFSPGADASDSFFKLITWLIDKTVAATNHGIPRIEFIPIVNETINKSKW